MQSLPSRVVEVYLAAKFDQRLVSFVKHSWTGLSLLPSSLCNETVTKISGLSVDDASKLSYSVHIQDLIVYFLKVPRLVVGGTDFQFTFLFFVGVLSL